MKRGIILWVIIPILALLIGCSPNTTQTELEDTKINLNQAQIEIGTLKNELTIAQDRIKELEINLVDTSVQLEKLKTDKAIRQKYIAVLNVLFTEVIYSSVFWEEKLKEMAEEMNDSILVVHIGRLSAEHGWEEVNWAEYWSTVQHCITKLSLEHLLE